MFSYFINKPAMFVECLQQAKILFLGLGVQRCTVLVVI